MCQNIVNKLNWISILIINSFGIDFYSRKIFTNRRIICIVSIWFASFFYLYNMKIKRTNDFFFLFLFRICNNCSLGIRCINANEKVPEINNGIIFFNLFEHESLSLLDLLICHSFFFLSLFRTKRSERNWCNSPDIYTYIYNV